MSELVCVILDGVRYAVRAERVLSRERVISLHRLPFADPRGGVLAMIGDRPETLADLSVCLGHSATPGVEPLHALVISQEPPVRGFIVGGDLVEVTGPDDALIPMPQWLPGGPFEGFLVLDAVPVPVIDIAALYAGVRAGAWTAPRIPLLLPPGPPTSCDPSVPHRVFRAAGVLYALAGRRQWEAVRVEGVFHSPLLPPCIDGISITEGAAVPVFDIGRRMGAPGTTGTLAVLASLEEARIAVVIDEDRGIWEPGSSVCRKLPALARPPGIADLLQRSAETAFLIELGALLSGGRVPGGSAQRAHHLPTSDFPSRFGHGEIEVQELVLLGMSHALPKSEVRAVVSRIPFREVPLTSPVVVGVADYEGDLLPVLDLSAGFGGEGRTAKGEDMILLENGDFRAFLLSEKVLRKRGVRRDDQRPVPYAASHPFLYGCYIDGETVRLIFNIAAIAMQFSLQPGTDVRATLARALGLAAENVTPWARPADEDEAPGSAGPVLPVIELPLAADAPVLREAPAAPPAPQGLAPVAEGSAPAETPRDETPDRQPRPAQAPPAEAPSGGPLTAGPQPSLVGSAGPVASGPAAPVPAEAVSTGASEAPGASVAPELSSDEPQLRIPEGAARSREDAPDGSARGPAGPSRAPDSRPGRLPGRKATRKSGLGRRLGIGIAVLVVAVAAVILLVPDFRAKVLPGGAPRVEAPTKPTPAPAAPTAPAVTTPAPAAPTAAAPASAPAAPAVTAPAVPTAPAVTPAPAAPAVTTPAPVAPAVPTEYVVVPGDTLASIARRFTGDSYQFQRLADENGIENPDLIFPGEKIRLTPK